MNPATIAGPRTMADVIALFPGNLDDLAAALKVTRQTLYTLRHAQHRKLPLDLLDKLARLLAKRGTVDASMPPARAQLVRIWRRESRR